jgi:hypothetical protein
MARQRSIKWQLGAEAAEHLLPKAESIFLGDIEHNGRRYQVYELVNPSIYHAYWISWWKDDPKFSYSPPGEPDGYGIYYRILSRLSLIDTLKVSQNLENCLYPLPTPTLTLRKP